GVHPRSSVAPIPETTTTIAGVVAGHGVDRSDCPFVGATGRSPVRRFVLVGRAVGKAGGLPVAPTDGGRSGVGAGAGGRAQPAPAARWARVWRAWPWRAAAAQRSMISALRAPWTRRLARTRARPDSVRAPVLLPPCRRQRPLLMAGWRQAQP